MIIPNRAQIRDILHNCKRSHIAYFQPSKIAKVFKDSKFYNGCKHDAQGYLYYKQNAIYIAFRGTMDLMDTRDIIDIRHQSLSSPFVKVHKGFHSQFFSIEQQITKDIADILQSYKVNQIVFTGHSLGGALAFIAAPFYAELLKKQKKKKDITFNAVSFGSVSVGNVQFLKWFLDNVDSHYRIENIKDIIPFVPVHPSFVHLPNRILLDSNGIVSTSNNDTQVYSSKLLQAICDQSTWSNGISSVFKDHACESYIDNLRAALKSSSVLQTSVGSMNQTHPAVFL